jgi:GNAT superfamily N-acetyltransferase
MTRRVVPIRRMTPTDVEPAADLLRRGEFGERRDFFRWAIEQPAIDVLVAAGEDGIRATGVASAHGNAGWVGVIFVAPDVRGSGLGRRITRAVLDRLEDRGCRTQVLIASPMGRPIYEREGFAVIDHQVRFTIDGLPPDDDPDQPSSAPGIRPFEPPDLPAIVALDRMATGEDRLVVLEALVTPASTLVAIDPGGSVRGYLARTPWRGGGLIAPDPADALRLLERRRRSTGVSGKAGAGVLASNIRGREALRAAGWHEEMGNVRMVRGEALDWHPEAIFGQFNGALG